MAVSSKCSYCIALGAKRQPLQNSHLAGADIGSNVAEDMQGSPQCHDDETHLDERVNTRFTAPDKRQPQEQEGRDQHKCNNGCHGIPLSVE